MNCRRWIVCGAWLLAAGCHGSNPGSPQDAAPDADFSICAGADAAPYMAGMTVVSKSGTYVATIASVMTASAGALSVDAPAVGLSTFTVTIANTSGGAAAGMTMTAEKPYMPFHKHSSPTSPVVMDQGGGTFVISAINFFMTGYFEITLDLTIPPAGDGGADDGGSVAAPTTDKIVLPICVPS